jgi:uncharacterized protein YecE (DUF72 family)
VSGGKVAIGTIGFPRSRKSALEVVDVVELKSAHPAPPRKSVGQRWREEAGPEVRFTVQGPASLIDPPAEHTGLEGDWRAHGGFRQTEENLATWARGLEFAGAVGAEAIVLLTGSSFTPSKTNITGFSSFLEKCERGGLDLVWEPRGPWEPERAAELARAHDLVLARDPLHDQLIEAERAYFRLGPFSTGTSSGRLSAYNLDLVVEALANYPRVTCVLDTPRALEDVQNLKKAWLNQLEDQW